MESENAFAYMVELYLRALPNLDEALDGFKFLNVVRECDTEIMLVGLSYVLPGDEIPMELTLQKSKKFTSYSLRFGENDSIWKSQTTSKRWKSVYLYAAGGHGKTWNWKKSVSGNLPNNIQ